MCILCGATQVLLPASFLPRRAYTVDVVGAVLLDVERGRSVARAAAAQLVPVSTARRWVHAVARSATALRVRAVRVAQVFGDVDVHGSPFASPPPVSGPLTAVLQALGDAVAAWTAAAASSAGSTVRAGALSGIDYLCAMRCSAVSLTE